MLYEVPDPGTSDDYGQFLWQIEEHPIGAAFGQRLWTTLRNGTRVAWAVPTAASPGSAATCGDDGTLC